MANTLKNGHTNQRVTKISLTLATASLLVIAAWALGMVFMPLALIPAIVAVLAIIKIWR